ncbi:MAG: DUF4383 domain-containing protein [Pseudonocardiaceae bacterium]|nr:DUF4383 domain-containing protein [Pseudonocardiaceae bacterium]
MMSLSAAIRSGSAHQQTVSTCAACHHLREGFVMARSSGAGGSLNKAVGVVFGAVYLLVGLFGLAYVDTAVDVLALNLFDHVLHFLSAVLLLVVGIIGDGARRRRTAAV